MSTAKAHVVADILPPEYLAAIGAIVVRWARLEFQLGVLIREGFGIDIKTGRALTIGMEISVLCGVIRTLTHDDQWIKDESLRKRIRKLGTDVNDKRDDRHNYAHGVFGFDMDNPGAFARYLFKASAHRINPQAEPIDLETMSKIADEARSFAERAIELTILLKASRRKSSSPLLRVQSHRKLVRIP